MNKKKRRNLRYDFTEKKWVVDFGGRQNRRRKFFGSRREAEQFMLSDVFLIAMGLKKPFVVENISNEKSLPLVDATNWYLKNVTAATKSRYSQKWEPMVFGHFRKHFEGKELHEIGLAGLLEYQSYLRKQGHLAPQTVNRRFNSIRAFLRTRL